MYVSVNDGKKQKQHRTVENEKEKWYNRRMERQMRLAEMEDELSAARTNKREFLKKLEEIILWEEFIKIIQSSYYKGEVGNKAYPLELMLRIFILQNVYDLADMAVMNEVIDSRAFSDFFCRVNSPDEVPNGDTIGRFRNILTENGIQEKIFAKVVKILTKRKLILKKGTIVDSTFIESPSSTKNKEKKRDPEAHSGKKGNTWHFGYKAHIGVDKKTGLVHHLKTTAANEHDVTVVPELLTGKENTIYGDSGYLGAEKRPEAILKNKKGKKIKYKINQRLSMIRKLSEKEQEKAKKKEHKKSSVRCKVEHVFAVVKHIFHYRKTRYRGLKKQAAKQNIVFALANLYLADRFSLSV